MTTLRSGPDSLDYAAMVQDALRTVARRALEQVAAYGLPGAHHFYLTFRTQAPGVQLSRSLVDQYPVEMTVVLQHEFHDLEVDAEAFAVTLLFSAVPQRLRVPFAALNAFYDPSAQFLLRFEGELADGAAEADLDADASPRRPGPRPVAMPALEPALEPAAEHAEDDADWDDADWDEADWDEASAGDEDEASAAEGADEDAAFTGGSERAGGDEARKPEPVRDDDRGNVVSIDRFRRDR